MELAQELQRREAESVVKIACTIEHLNSIAVSEDLCNGKFRVSDCKSEPPPQCVHSHRRH